MACWAKARAAFSFLPSSWGDVSRFFDAVPLAAVDVFEDDSARGFEGPARGVVVEVVLALTGALYEQVLLRLYGKPHLGICWSHHYCRPGIFCERIIIISPSVQVMLPVEHLVRLQKLKPPSLSGRSISNLLLLQLSALWMQATPRDPEANATLRLTSSSSFARCLSFSALSASSLFNETSFCLCSSKALAFACLYYCISSFAWSGSVDEDIRRTCLSRYNTLGSVK